ncbi:MAG: polysaccharide deacetylase family protein [Oscillibacter sp.]
MFLYSLARKVNGQLKKYKRAQAGKHLSPVRRVEFVAPPAGGRFCAMTFDDGPCAMPPKPWTDQRGLTEVLLDTLKEYGAKGTFDVIGTTADNYPDTEGKLDDFSWSGVGYDHYPRFGQDKLAGAVNQPELISRILAEGHEITNHGYVHRLFGPMRAVYGGRKHFLTLEEVLGDLTALDRYMKDRFGYEMKLSRPPHYIDHIPDGATSYDAYRVMGYQYMGAKFDGGGWLPTGENYDAAVEKMVAPIADALAENPDSLNGMIIFQKDGCNMSLETPIAHALPKQLELLRKAGYQVVTVSELLAMSAFEDVAADAAELTYIQALLKRGHIVGYPNNTFHGERAITSDEFALMLCTPARLKAERHLDYKEMVQLARQACEEKQLPLEVSGAALLRCAKDHGIVLDTQNFTGSKVLRRHAVELIAKLVQQLNPD